MDREKVIIELANRKDIKDYVLNVAKGDGYYSEELYQELFLVLCNLSDEKLNELMSNSTSMNYYILRVISNMFNSNSSPFYYKIKRPIQTKIEIPESDSEGNTGSFLDRIADDSSPDAVKNSDLWLQALDEAKNGLYWADRRIFDLWLELKTFKAVSKFTGIGTQYISDTVKRCKEHLKDVIPEIVQDKKENRLWD